MGLWEASYHQLLSYCWSAKLHNSVYSYSRIISHHPWELKSIYSEHLLYSLSHSRGGLSHLVWYFIWSRPEPMNSEVLRSSISVLVIVYLYRSVQGELKDFLVGIGWMAGCSLKSFWLVIWLFSFLPRTRQTLVMEGWDCLSAMLLRCWEEFVCQ